MTKNPICKCCSDDNSPSLSNKGWCVYCEKAYKKGREKQDKVWTDLIKNKIKELKKRKKNLIGKNSRWAMQMAIEEMEVLV